MGHVKVVKSSPYFSRFQTKVCAAALRRALASRSLCSQSKGSALLVSLSAGGGHQRNLMFLAQTEQEVFVRAAPGVASVSQVQPSSVSLGMCSTSGGRAARQTTEHAFG